MHARMHPGNANFRVPLEREQNNPCLIYWYPEHLLAFYLQLYFRISESRLLIAPCSSRSNKRNHLAAFTLPYWRVSLLNTSNNKVINAIVIFVFISGGKSCNSLLWWVFWAQVVLLWKLLGVVLRGGAVPVPGMGQDLLKAAEAAAKMDFNMAF